MRRGKEYVKHTNANARVRASAVDEAGAAGVQLTTRKDYLIHNARRELGGLFSLLTQPAAWLDPLVVTVVEQQSCITRFQRAGRQTAAHGLCGSSTSWSETSLTRHEDFSFSYLYKAHGRPPSVMDYVEETTHTKAPSPVRSLTPGFGMSRFTCTQTECLPGTCWCADILAVPAKGWRLQSGC